MLMLHCFFNGFVQIACSEKVWFGGARRLEIWSENDPKSMPGASKMRSGVNFLDLWDPKSVLGMNFGAKWVPKRSLPKRNIDFVWFGMSFWEPKVIKNLSKIKLGTLMKFRTDFGWFLSAIR